MQFQDLRRKIRDCLGSDAGLNTSDAHLEELINAMQCYESVDDEWQQFALGDTSRAYTRNLVDECNGNANLLVLVWNPAKVSGHHILFTYWSLIVQSSPVHCHSNAHCLMKVLSGRLQETLYDWPEGARPMTPRAATKDDLAPRRSPEQEQPMVIKRTTVLNRNDVTYISDALGLHRIGNPSETDVAISLHLYTPPWAAK